jgi:hypothetical protein
MLNLVLYCVDDVLRRGRWERSEWGETAIATGKM